jgi:hypothetical protein
MKNNKINILILAVDANNENISDPIKMPLCLTENNGISLLELIVKNSLNILDSEYIFSFSQKSSEYYHLDKISKLLQPKSKYFLFKNPTGGSCCTSLFSLSNSEQDNELLIISANEYLKLDYSLPIEFFRSKKFDGGLIYFKSLHPRYSYIRLINESVTEVAPLEPISNNAIATFFWYASTTSFIKSAQNLIRNKCNTSGSYYASSTFNELILMGKKVGGYEIKNESYQPLKTEFHTETFAIGKPF